MAPELVITLICVGTFVVLILLEVPIGISIGLAGTIGILLLNGEIVASQVVGTVPFSATAKYALVVIPMYILLGTLISNTGIGTDIYRAVNRVARRLPGGLAATAVIATALFSGISGSSAADVATFGRISVNEMSRHGYDRAYASAVVAAAGAFAALIPPSVTIVLYAIIAEQNVAAMILAAVIPGIISALALVIFVSLRAFFGGRQVGGKRDDRALAEALSMSLQEAKETGALLRKTETGTVIAPMTGTTSIGVGSLRRDLLAVLYAVIIFGIVVGGLYGGVFTATESGAIGAFVALIIALVARGSRQMSLGRMLKLSLQETANVTSMIFLLLIGGAIFAFFVASSGLARDMTAWASELAVDPIVIVILFLAVLLVLGAFLDGLSTMLVAVPLMAPVVEHLGFSGIWFGILVLKVIEIGLITPPVGINTFIIAGIAKVPIIPVFKRLWPFVVLDLVVTAILLIFPDIILWLPRAAGMVP